MVWELDRAITMLCYCVNPTTGCCMNSRDLKEGMVRFQFSEEAAGVVVIAFLYSQHYGLIFGP